MTTELEPIDDAVVIHCRECGSELIVSPSDVPGATLEHHADGSHTFHSGPRDPDLEPTPEERETQRLAELPPEPPDGDPDLPDDVPDGDVGALEPDEPVAPI